MEKLKRANFISVLSDGSTDAAIVEKEYIYILFVDPNEFKPKLLFFALKEPISQDIDGLYDAIKMAFSDKNADTLLKNVVFFSSDGIAVNSSLNAGIIAKFKESYSWVVFIWCVSHWLELALKDALKNWFESVDTCVHVYYLYEKSTKKLRELKALYEILSEMYEFSNNCMKPHSTTGTCWIDHKMKAMEEMLDKYGVYMKHIENVLADEKKKTAKATSHGKRGKLLEAATLFCVAFFFDFLESTKMFSLISQKEDINILTITDILEDTQSR